MIRIQPRTGHIISKRNDPDNRDQVIYLRDREIVQWDGSKSAYAILCLDSSLSDRTIALPHHLDEKTRYTLEIRQDSIGGAKVNFDSSFVFPSGTVNLNSEPLTVYRIEFLSRSREGEIVLESISIMRVK